MKEGEPIWTGGGIREPIERKRLRGRENEIRAKYVRKVAMDSPTGEWVSLSSVVEIMNPGPKAKIELLTLS